MTSLDTQTTQGQAEQTQPGTQQAQAPLQVGQSPSTGTVPGLPPTALSMQMQSMNDQYEAQQQSVGGMQAMGAELQTGGPLIIDPEPRTGSRPAPGAPAKTEYAQQGLQDMAEQLARSYGLNFSRGSLVDAEGNFQRTPDQMAGAGGDVADIAANMTYVAQAINDWQVDQQQNKATAALQAGMGQMQQRGRGSLAAMQSNFYQAMAANYTNPNLLPEQADFSYWIQKAGFDEAAANRAKEEAEQGLTGGGGGGGGGGGTGPGGAPIVTRDDIYNPGQGSVMGPEGKGDVVTTGPHAGQRPVYTYDPINQTTTITWEDV